LLFPGQGAYHRDALPDLEAFYPETHALVAEIDRVAHAHLGVTLAGNLDTSPAPTLDDLRARTPALVDLSIYAIEICTQAALRASGVAADVCLGHSFGEVAALVGGGALTVADGAELVCHRVAALQQYGVPGAMTVVGADSATVERIIELVDSKHCAQAAENAPGQAVVAGAPDAIAKVEAVARALDTSTHRLPVDYAFHCAPLMQRTADTFAARVRHLRGSAGRAPVYSPILGRYYTSADHIGECLARHMAMPVQFMGAVRRLYDEGARIFIECSPRNILGALSTAVAAPNVIEVVTCLERRGTPHPLAAALERLRAAQVLPQTDMRGLREMLLPEAGVDEFQRFWERHGLRLRAEMRAAFTQFLAGESPAEEDTAGLPVTAAQDGAALWDDVRDLYATVLEYPADVLTPEAELEGELGIDSVKQMELLSRLQQRYHLPPLPDDFRLPTLDTLGKVVAYISSARTHSER
jgi:acyl transferase domain-containing protein